MMPFSRHVTSPQPPGRLTAAGFQRRYGLAVALCAAALPASVGAIGLGKAIGDPVLGESLRVEVPLTGSIDRPVDSECIAVRRATESIDDDYLPRDLSVRLDRQATPPRFVLTTRSPLRQPLVQFRLVVTCGYNLSSDYLLAVSPPATAAAVVPAPLAEASAVTAVRVPAPAEATAKAMPDGLAAERHTVDQGMTLHQLARKHFPGPLRQERFMRWVAEANPEIFRGAANLGQFKLPAGTSLYLPVGIPPRRPGDHANVAAEAVERPAAEKAAKSATPRDRSPQADKLVVGAGGSRRDLRETMALVDRLTAMAEQQMAAQTAATEKITALETALADLNKYVLQLEATSREREARLQLESDEARKQLAQQAEQGWWQLLLAVIGGGLIGVGLMFAFGRFFARKSSAGADALAIESLAAPVPAVDAEQAILDSFADATMVSDDIVAPAVPVDSTPAPRPAPTGIPVKAEEVVIEPPYPRAEPLVSDSGTAPASDPATAAIELANIMTSMGLAESAAQTLVEHIRENPRQSLHHWLKLLDLHRINGNREEFERSTEEMRQHFNVRADDWDRTAAVSPRNSLESYSHIRSKLIELWRQPECVQFLQSLLMDNREGTRTGFPLPVAEEILLLIAIQSNT